MRIRNLPGTGYDQDYPVRLEQYMMSVSLNTYRLTVENNTMTQLLKENYIKASQQMVESMFTPNVDADIKQNISSAIPGQIRRWE
jgi:hypothetical protein